MIIIIVLLYLALVTRPIIKLDTVPLITDNILRQALG